jgi:hypothetical protein
MSNRKTLRALKGTTFTDLFDLPAQAKPVRPVIVDRDEFNENLPAIALGIIYDIMMSPDSAAYVKIEAARELMNRAEGKPVQRQVTIGSETKSLTEAEINAKIMELSTRFLGEHAVELNFPTPTKIIDDNS